MKKKEVEDILGGKGAWDNVDKTEGTFKLVLWRGAYRARKERGEERVWKIYDAMETLWTILTCRSTMSQREVPKRPGILVPAADSQCRRAHDCLLQVHKVREGVARIRRMQRVV